MTIKNAGLLLGASMLAACAATPAPQAPMTASTPVPAAAPEPTPAPKPQYGIFGFDSAGMDQSIRAGDNFYQYANGTWAKNTPIPADKANYGMFAKLDDLSKEPTRLIIEDAAKDASNKIGAAYASYLDQPAVEAKGLAPFQPWLNQIKAVDSKSDLPALYAAADRMGISQPFPAYVGLDDKVNTQYAYTLVQGGIGMPDRDYYLAKDARMAGIRAKYLEHLTNVLTLAGEPNPAARARAIVAFETGVAKAHWTQVASRDATKTYNKMTLAQLQKRAPGFNFPTFLTGVGVNSTELLVAQPSAIAGIAAQIAKAPLGVLKDQMLVRSLDGYAAYLPSAFDKEAFSFYGTTLSGTPEQEARWKRGVNFTVGSLGDQVSQLYVQRFFPAETKAAADELVRNVVAAMGRRIDNLPWMATQTKARARAKLANFTTKIG